MAFGLTVAVGLALLSAILFLPSPAGAAISHQQIGQFQTEAGLGEDLAVDGAGNVYVLDNTGRRILRYTATGAPAPFSALKTNAIDGASVPAETNSQRGFEFYPQSNEGVAVDSSGGPADSLIYVTNQKGGLASVSVFDATGTFVGELPLEPSAIGLCGVAVNAAGRILIGRSFVGRAEEFTPTSADPAQDTLSGALTVSNACAGAIDANRNVFMRDPGVGEVANKYEAAELASGGPAQPSPYAPTPFAEGIKALDVDQGNGDVYLDTGSGVLQYTGGTSAEPARRLGPPLGEGQVTESRGVAVDRKNGRIFVSDGSNGVLVFNLAPIVVPDVVTDPAAVGKLGHKSATLSGSVDPAGGGPVTECNLEYGTDTTYSEGKVPCDQKTPFTAATEVSAELTGLTTLQTYHYRFSASNASGINYGEDQVFAPPAVLDVETKPATEIMVDSARLNGSFTIDSEGGATSYYFEYGADATYGFSTTVESAGAEPGPKAIGTVATDLQAGSEYHFRLVATDSLGTTYGQDEIFSTFSPPTIEVLSAQNLTASTADLLAEVNPQGSATTVYFEYGPTGTYGSTTAAEQIGSGFTPQRVLASLTGLQPRATYHFRVVATNGFGTVVSEDQTFNFFPPNCPNASLRQETNTSTLPDCRAYELVSAANTNGTTIFPAGGPFSAYASNPPRLTYTGNFGTIPGTGGDPINTLGDLYLAERTSEGWISRYIGLPANQTSLNAGPPENLGFPACCGEPDKIQRGVQVNPDMSLILNWNLGNKTLSGGLSDENRRAIPSLAPYLWNSDNTFLERLPSNLDSVPGGVKAMQCPRGISGGASCDGYVVPETVLVDYPTTTIASADLSHYVFSSVTAAFAPGGNTSQPGSLYDENRETHVVSLISVDSTGAPLEGDEVPGGSVESRSILVPGFRTSEPGISDDGTHIVMAASDRLYMRVDDRVTYDIAPGHSLKYVGLTDDGSKLYFTSPEQLTGEDTDTSSDLYLWSESTKALTLVSAGNGDSCNASWTSQCDVAIFNPFPLAETQGGLGGNGTSDTFIADDGEIYFLSPQVLDGTRGVKGKVNLYVYRDGRPQHVATMNPGSYCIVERQNQGEYCSAGPLVRIQVTDDGKHAAFLSLSPLTSYENAGHPQMYVYDPARRVVQCASCIVSGAPPTTDARASQNGGFLTADGRVFFSTGDALVPQDTNKLVDVYEYVEGRAQLITSGTSAADVTNGVIAFQSAPGLVSVSADGRDAYFASFANLVPQNQNGNALAIYDARTGGGFPYVAPAPGCEAADECHGETSAGLPPVANGTTSNLGASGKKHRKHLSAKQRKAKKRKARQRAKAKKRRARQRAKAQRRASHKHGGADDADRKGGSR